MNLTQNIKDGVYAGTSIVLIVFAILELVSIIIAVVIAYSWMNGTVEGTVNGIMAIMYWLVAWLLQQIYVLPITIALDKLNKWSK